MNDANRMCRRLEKDCVSPRALYSVLQDPLYLGKRSSMRYFGVKLLRKVSRYVEKY